MVSRAGAFAIALLGRMLQSQLFSGSHMAMAVAAVACALATRFIVEPGSHIDFISRD